jgi:UDP-N-acetylmuramoyl-tripeptide--D-alanyl-D-alanine ligase
VLGQKIVVLGDMLELGDKSELEHRNIGKFLNTLDFDYIFCFGDMSRFIVNEIKSLGLAQCMFFDDKKNLAKKLKEILKPNDLVYVKGFEGMKLEEYNSAIFKLAGGC